MAALSRFFKEHLLGIFIFAIVTGVISSFIYNAIHRSDASRLTTTSTTGVPLKPDDRVYFAVLTYTPNEPYAQALDHLDCMHNPAESGSYSVNTLKPGEQRMLFSHSKPIVVRLAYHPSVGALQRIQSDYYTLEAVAFDGRYPTKTEQQEATPHFAVIGPRGDFYVSHDGHELEGKKSIPGVPEMTMNDPE